MHLVKGLSPSSALSPFLVLSPSPFLMGIWKVVPAIAAGCTIILKPSELAPLSCILLAEMVAEEMEKKVQQEKLVQMD